MKTAYHHQVHFVLTIVWMWAIAIFGQWSYIYVGIFFLCMIVDQYLLPLQKYEESPLLQAQVAEARIISGEWEDGTSYVYMFGCARALAYAVMAFGFFSNIALYIFGGVIAWTILRIMYTGRLYRIYTEHQKKQKHGIFSLFSRFFT